jgi:hypothetical protein
VDRSSRAYWPKNPLPAIDAWLASVVVTNSSLNMTCRAGYSFSKKRTAQAALPSDYEDRFLLCRPDDAALLLPAEAAVDDPPSVVEPTTLPTTHAN